MIRICWLLGLLLLLPGCSSENRELEAAMKFRETLLAAQSCSFDAEITADYGDSLNQFRMGCQADSSGTIAFEVLAPETITGIKGNLSYSGGELTFDDTALYFDLLTDDQLTPVSAPWIVLKALRSGYITSVCREESGLRVTVDDSYESDALTLDVWLEDDRIPVRADIFWDNRKIVSLIVEAFALS